MPGQDHSCSYNVRNKKVLQVRKVKHCTWDFIITHCYILFFTPPNILSMIMVLDILRLATGDQTQVKKLLKIRVKKCKFFLGNLIMNFE